jgi:hypothetical protein
MPGSARPLQTPQTPIISDFSHIHRAIPTPEGFENRQKRQERIAFQREQWCANGGSATLLFYSRMTG